MVQLKIKINIKLKYYVLTIFYTSIGISGCALVITVVSMAIRVVEFSNGGFKIRKVFA